jgi:hypothetical protein
VRLDRVSIVSRTLNHLTSLTGLKSLNCLTSLKPRTHSTQAWGRGHEVNGIKRVSSIARAQYAWMYTQNRVGARKRVEIAIAF